MAKFTDVKILEYTESKNYRNEHFADWANTEHHYLISEDAVIRSIEQAYWSYERATHPLPNHEAVVQAQDMDHTLLPVLAKMEFNGVYVEQSILERVSAELKEKADRLEREMVELVGETFNPLSAKQVQYILYEKLHIPTGKKIKTGFSVDSETLEEIAKDYAIAGLILEYRGYEKLRSTYAEGLQKEIRPATGRIHTTYKQTLASTGRLASMDPNLQNIPTGAGYGREIKSAFRPSDPASVFVVADYSQVELRVLAGLSGDTELMGAFMNDEDIHARTARFLFPTSATISGEQRRIAKSVNFGVIYGITGFGLSKMLKVPPREATQYIDTFYAKYPGVRAYYDGVLEEARKTGYVETHYGRRRYIKGITDANSMVRAGAEREAINMPVQ